MSTYSASAPDEGDEVPTDWEENEDDIEVDGE